MSTVVYRTKCKKWSPHKLCDAFPESDLLVGPAINAKKNVAYVVTRENSQIEWGSVREFLDTAYELYLLHWDAQRQLLFIHTSNNEAAHDGFAEIVAGSDVELMRGAAVFRVFSGLNRLLLQTLGLTHAVGRLIRFTMLVGGDIHSELAEAHIQTKVKTNIFASGYSMGRMISVGCSRKGRIWSRRSAGHILEWVEWCNEIGAKLQDANFSEKHILENSTVPEDISERPALVPLAFEWPDAVYARDDASIHIEFGSRKENLYRVGVELLTHDETSPIRIRFFTQGDSAEYELRYSLAGTEYVQMQGPELSVLIGKAA